MWRIPPQETLRASRAGPIAEFPADATPGFDGDRKNGTRLLADYGTRLAQLQEKLFAEGRAGGERSFLLVLQGMDTAGKGGIARHVGGTMDPQGLTVRGFGKPTDEELANDFLWRIRKALPPSGQIGIFDRSHYEDVLPVRVHNLVPEAQWRSRYAAINAFERELTASGTTVIKCALVVSKAEQKRRIARRLDRPDKHWKYDPGDIAERAHWDRYLAAYQDIFDLTDTDAAPWYLIPADRKWFSRLAVARLLVDGLTAMDLRWPAADFDIATERRRIAALEG
nr:PPK2 family polyphosphate kinase [Gordonia hirsuta]